MLSVDKTLNFTPKLNRLPYLNLFTFPLYELYEYFVIRVRTFSQCLLYLNQYWESFKEAMLRFYSSCTESTEVPTVILNL